MRDLQVWFTLWLTAMVVLMAMPAEGRPKGPLHAGACVEGKPVVDHWDPSLRIEFEPACQSERLTLQPAVGSGKPLAEPEDFGAWAFVRLDRQRLRNPYHDAYPYVTGTAGGVLVTLRMGAEALGGEVGWDAAGRQVSLTWRGVATTLTIGSTEAMAGKQRIALDAAPVLWRDRTMVSPAAIAQIFGAEVTWDGESYQVQIRRGGILCSPDYCIKS